MKILLIGNGAREHALAWKINQSPLVSHIFVAPGNAGTALEPRVQNINIAVDAIDQLIKFALQNTIDLTVVGPELPLSLGIVDRFMRHGLLCFGPTKACAQLESSKAYAKAFMQRHHIPTARYATFTDLNQALEYLQQQQYPVVIKADGLAAGKGVVIAQDHMTAQRTVKSMLTHQALGNAGTKIVIEEFLYGEEASFIVIADGDTVIPCASSQDHKARNDGDTGPNTGGMGAYSPAPVITAALHQKILETIIHPTLEGLAKEGHRYQGFLYAGLMISPQGEIKVLEFNCRSGDPETQPIMMRLKSDLVPLLLDTAKGKLQSQSLEWDPRIALGVVLATASYPDSSSRGAVIHGLPSQLPADCHIFHAGTTLNSDNKIATNGGRILTVTVLAASIGAAQQHVYEIASPITWEGGVHYRKDIGWRAKLGTAAP